jgi:hypothetical protein
MAVTLLQMRDAAKDICDHVGDPNVSDTTWTRWINDGIEKLYRIVAARDSGAFQTFTDSTLTAASNLIAKPATFRRLLGVTMDPTIPSLRRSLPKFNFQERDSMGTLGPRSYRVVGQSIAIEPFQLCAGNYRLHYVAGPTILSGDTDVIDVVLEPYDDYATTWAAIKALGKEESDNRDLYAELATLQVQIDEMFSGIDGSDPSSINDDDSRGPALWQIP